MWRIMFIVKPSPLPAPDAWRRLMPINTSIKSKPKWCSRPASVERSMSVIVLQSLTDVSADEWNALALHGNPFLRHEFLLALEQHECADAGTGWQAHHLLLRDDKTRALIGAVPLYLKNHSWGEFVFDWSWASAFSQ